MSLPPAIPLPLPDDVLRELVPKTKDWALMHGAAMRSKKEFSLDALNFAPFILTPSAFPRKEFYHAVHLQPLLNKLSHAVAYDREFLIDCLRETIKVDSFTRQLFDIYDKVYAEGITQPLTFSVLRSDVMLDSAVAASNAAWKQVELNTIASGFGWLGPASRRIQRFVLEELGHSEKCVNLPENRALEGICSGMLDAHKLYNVMQAVILFVVENVTYNICDQRFHEFEIAKQNPNVKVKRRNLTEIARNGRLGDRKQLIIDGFEVAVVYFRAGYEPDQYMSEAEWDARLMIERSLAIKCPSINYHLAGTKKVQQELARPGCLERFLKTPEEVAAVRAIFTGLYSLDMDEAGAENVKMALANPERFVLKPQREGGGNNVYGAEVGDVLRGMKDAERSAYILMERIHPPISRSYMIRPGGPAVPEMVDLVSELGIFGVIIGNEQEILLNKHVGHMLRTKVATANEGGVASGLGALDSPYLID